MDNFKELKEFFTLKSKVISDNHFGHPKCFEEHEPIRKQFTLQKGKNTLQDFEKLMITQWNNKVSKTDYLVHLGDFCINKMDDQKTLQNIKNNTRVLNGKKLLIKGNHDKTLNEVYLNNGWNFVIDKPLILLEGQEKFIETEYNYTGCVIVEINGIRTMFSHFGLFMEDERFENKYKKEFEFLKDLFNKYKCEYNVHGHSHSKGNNTEFSSNISVEKINFTPVDLFQVFLTAI